MFNKKQVNLVVKDRIIRYMISTQPSLTGIVDYGEKILDANIIEDGKIIDHTAIQAVIEKLVKEKKWNNSKLFFCVPDSFVTIREQLVPKELTKQEMKSYIYMELEESIRLPFSDPVIDFVIVGEEDGQAKILLFAYPKERINEYVQLFEKAGLKPTVADLSSLCLYRLYYQLDQASNQEHLLSVQWGKDSIVLTAFNQSKPIFTRHIKSSLDRSAWTRSGQENELIWTGNDQEIEQTIQDQLVTIERFMAFYQYSVTDGKELITKILLSGDFPYLKRTEQLMKERYTIAIGTMENLEGQMSYPAKYSDVLGLAIKK